MAVPCLTIVNDGSDGAPIQIKWTVGGNMGNALAFDEETGNFVVYNAPCVAVDLIEYHSDGTFSVYGWSPPPRDHEHVGLCPFRLSRQKDASHVRFWSFYAEFCQERWYRIPELKPKVYLLEPSHQATGGMCFGE